TFITNGSWTNFFGSTVTYMGQSDNSQVTLATPTYSYMTVSKAGTVFALPSALTANNNVDISSGVLDLQGNNMIVGGALINAAELRLRGTEIVTSAPTNLSGSTVTYENTAGTTVLLSTWTYKNLVINGSGGTFNAPTGGLTVGESLTVSGG